MVRLLDPSHHGFLFPLTAALLILGSAWLFLGVLEDVVAHDPLVDVDVMVHDTLQKRRTPPMDGVMVAITEIGDVQVILPIILAALARFVLHLLWQTSLYWLAVIGLAEILAKVLKFALHRPSDVIAGMSFGLAWIGALAVVYHYRTDEDVKPTQLFVWLSLTLLLSGVWHLTQDHGRDLLHYALLP